MWLLMLTKDQNLLPNILFNITHGHWHTHKNQNALWIALCFKMKILFQQIVIPRETNRKSIDDESKGLCFPHIVWRNWYGLLNHSLISPSIFVFVFIFFFFLSIFQPIGHEPIFCSFALDSTKWEKIHTFIIISCRNSDYDYIYLPLKQNKSKWNKSPKFGSINIEAHWIFSMKHDQFYLVYCLINENLWLRAKCTITHIPLKQGARELFDRTLFKIFQIEYELCV